MAEAVQVQTCEGSAPREEILSGYGAAFVHVASNYDSDSKVVAGTVFLGRD